MENITEVHSSEEYKKHNFKYVPPYHSPRNTSALRRYVGLIVESFMNGFGKKIPYRGDSKLMEYEKGRGDTNHRAGTIISASEHNQIVNDSYIGFEAFLKNYVRK